MRVREVARQEGEGEGEAVSDTVERCPECLVRDGIHYDWCPVGDAEDAAEMAAMSPEALHPGDVVLVTGQTDPALNGLRVVGDDVKPGG